MPERSRAWAWRCRDSGTRMTASRSPTRAWRTGATFPLRKLIEGWTRLPARLIGYTPAMAVAEQAARAAGRVPGSRLHLRRRSCRARGHRQRGSPGRSVGERRGAGSHHGAAGRAALLLRQHGMSGDAGVLQGGGGADEGERSGAVAPRTRPAILSGGRRDGARGERRRLPPARPGGHAAGDRRRLDAQPVEPRVRRPERPVLRRGGSRARPAAPIPREPRAPQHAPAVTIERSTLGPRAGALGAGVTAIRHALRAF
jgi:hypothetical protein